MSWPTGFRATEFDSGEYRALVESSYERDEYSHVDPRAGGDRRQPYGDQGHGDQRYGGQPGNNGRAADYDPGYGDPGYADPGYDGPRGYQPPARQDFRHQLPAAAAPDPIYPVTGAQEVYREPEQPRQVDPRLVGLRYDELRYDDINLDDRGLSQHDEPLDDEAWYAELRSNAPAQPQRPAPGGRGQGPAAPYGRTPEHPSASGPSANGPSLGGPSAAGGPSGGGRPGGSPYGGPSGPAARNIAPGSGGPGPRMGALPVRAGAATAKGMPRNPAVGYKAAAPARPAAGFAPNGFLGAPVAQVGVLTPPSGNRYAGPETVAWNKSQDVDSGEFDRLEEYWEQEESDVEYTALLVDLDDDRVETRRDTGTGAQSLTTRQRIGRRRGRSGDRRLWFGLGGVVVVAAAAIFLIIKFEFPADGGVAHTLSMPNKIGSSFVTSKAVDQKDLDSLRNEFVTKTHGQATDVLSGTFESGGPTTGGTPQIVMTIDAHLANDDPASSIAGFMQEYKNAVTVPAGPLGGQAACAEQTAKNANNVAICAWFDNDSFGVDISPSMNAKSLAGQLATFRAAVEQVAKS